LGKFRNPAELKLLANCMVVCPLKAIKRESKNFILYINLSPTRCFTEFEQYKIITLRVRCVVSDKLLAIFRLNITPFPVTKQLLTP